MDLGDPAARASLSAWLAGVDAVVHLAWQIRRSHQRARLRWTNVTGTTHLRFEPRYATGRTG